MNHHKKTDVAISIDSHLHNIHFSANGHRRIHTHTQKTTMFQVLGKPGINQSINFDFYSDLSFKDPLHREGGIMSRKVSSCPGNIQEMTLKGCGLWNVDNDSSDVTSAGKSFQIGGLTTGKAT